MLEIAPLLDRQVPQLSGGERQRVALARALMSAPELLLLDEPLAAVDVERRRRILPYLERVRDELMVPIIYVTHDPAEVRQLAEHVVILDERTRHGRRTGREHFRRRRHIGASCSAAAPDGDVSEPLPDPAGGERLRVRGRLTSVHRAS